MVGLSTGILTNAYPLTSARIKELESVVLNQNKCFVYLDENSELCFMLPKGIDSIKDLAWNNVYELSISDGTLIKKAYKKNGLRSFYLDKTLSKQHIDDQWVHDGSVDESFSVNMLSSDGYILKDLNGIYLTAKENK